MKRKVVITHSSQLSERWYNYYCLDSLAVAFELEYWDCSEITTPSFKATNLVETIFVKKINSLQSLKTELNRIPHNTLIVNDIHFTEQNYNVLKAIHDKFTNIVYIDFFITINFNKKYFANPARHLLFLVFNKLLYLTNWEIARRMRLFFLTGSDKAYQDTIIRSRLESLFNIYVISAKPNQRRKINSPDIERYLDLQKKIQYKNQIVYISQYFPYHSEIKKYNPNVVVEKTAKTFFSSICHFFDMIELATGAKVVIAEHPTAVYKSNPYGNRKIFYGKTADLVNESFAVLMHSSNAIVFPFLFKKPIILLHNKSMDQVYSMKDLTFAFSERYNIPLLNTDNVDSKNISIPNVNEHDCDKFFNDMFGSFDGKGERNSQLLVRYLTEIYDEVYGKESPK